MHGRARRRTRSRETVDSRIVLDDPVRVRLDPEIEEEEHDAADPAQDVEEDRVARRARQGEEREREEDVGQEVVQEDDVDAVAEQDPDLLRVQVLKSVCASCTSRGAGAGRTLNSSGTFCSQ